MGKKKGDYHMDNNNQKKIFLAFHSGIDNNGVCYAHHVEGFVTSSKYNEATSDKKSVLRLGVRIGRNPWLLLGEKEVAAEANNQFVNAEKPFINVYLFGSRADELKDIPDKSKVVFCGKATKSNFKKDDGTTGTSIRVAADNLFVLPTKNTPENLWGKPDRQVSPIVNVYNGKNGPVTERLVCLVSGTVKSVSPKTVVNGKSVVNFGLEVPVPAAKVHALCQGTYQKDADYGKYQVIRGAIWGPRADHMDKVLVPGNTLVVSGSTRANEYKDNTYIDMTCRALTVLSWATPAEESGSVPASTAPAAATPTPAAPTAKEPSDEDYDSLMYDIEDGDLPF